MSADPNCSDCKGTGTHWIWEPDYQQRMPRDCRCLPWPRGDKGKPPDHRSGKAPTMSLSKVKIAVAPLSGRIMLYRHGKDTTLALEKRDVTDEVLSAAAQHAERQRSDTKPRPAT